MSSAKKVSPSKKVAGKKAKSAGKHPTKPVKEVQITKLALQRILHRAAVTRIGSSSFDKLRSILTEWLTGVCRDMLVFTSHSGRKTVSVEDISAALEARDLFLGAGLNQNASYTASLQSFTRGVPTKPHHVKVESEDGENEKTHR